MPGALRAGLVYGAAAFACGFVLGPVRVLVLEPRFGPLGAVAIEAVPMLSALALLAPRIARAHGLGGGAAGRLAMGLMALGLVVVSEVALSLALGRFGAWVAGFATPAGLIGLALLAALALMPLLRR